MTSEDCSAPVGLIQSNSMKVDFKMLMLISCVNFIVKVVNLIDVLSFVCSFNVSLVGLVCLLDCFVCLFVYLPVCLFVRYFFLLLHLCIYLAISHPVCLLVCLFVFCLLFFLLLHLCIYLAISHPVKKCESLLELCPKTAHPIFQSTISTLYFNPEFL